MQNQINFILLINFHLTLTHLTFYKVCPYVGGQAWNEPTYHVQPKIPHFRDRDELQDKLDEEAANYRDLEDRIKEVRHRDRYMKTVETERKRTTFYRKKMLELAEQLQFEQQEVTGETPLWKLCEICAHQFSHSDEYVPRVLGKKWLKCSLF